MNNLEKSTSEAHAYTPGLKVKKSTIVTKQRILPIPGEVLVKVGDKVDFDTIVARAKVPGKPNIIRAADLLNIQAENLPAFMLKKEGDIVAEGEVIAKYTPLFGLIKRFVRSPVKGIVESISDMTGQVIIREPPELVEIKSYIPGRVRDVIPKRGVIIETQAAFIQGIFGIGGERHGEIYFACESPSEVLTGENIDDNLMGKIIVGGSLATLDSLKKASQVGAAGIVVGGIKGVDIKEYLGYEIGVAITGHEEIPITLVVTEGFGKMNMSSRVFNLLKEFEGLEAAINGATQIRAGVIRPEIIIPHENHSIGEEEKSLEKGMGPGTLVRIIREPYFGKIGIVVSLPVELLNIETESSVRVVEVRIDEGNVIVPRANVEIIEE
ncbi:MAG: hypothetical protein QW638_08350 [Candidatus Bathyarchaeia archaeon]